MRHGYGEMHWVDGSVYKGDWVMGVKHGIGSIQLKDGKIKKGRFENNNYIGKVADETARPGKLSAPLETLREDPEEEMRVSKAGPFLGDSKDALVGKDGGAPGGSALSPLGGVGVPFPAQATQQTSLPVPLLQTK